MPDICGYGYQCPTFGLLTWCPFDCLRYFDFCAPNYSNSVRRLLSQKHCNIFILWSQSMQMSCMQKANCVQRAWSRRQPLKQWWAWGDVFIYKTNIVLNLKPEYQVMNEKNGHKGSWMRKMGISLSLASDWASSSKRIVKDEKRNQETYQYWS